MQEAGGRERGERAKKAKVGEWGKATQEKARKLREKREIVAMGKFSGELGFEGFEPVYIKAGDWNKR